MRYAQLLSKLQFVSRSPCCGEVLLWKFLKGFVHTEEGNTRSVYISENSRTLLHFNPAFEVQDLCCKGAVSPKSCHEGQYFLWKKCTSTIPRNPSFSRMNSTRSWLFIYHIISEWQLLCMHCIPQYYRNGGSFCIVTCVWWWHLVSPFILNCSEKW
jgi:hypothetical protein